MREAADNTASNGNITLRLTAFVSLPAFLALVLALAISFFPGLAFAQGGLPPGGITYYGDATIDGEPVPDGQTIVGRIGDYESKPVTVSRGKYAALSVAADASLSGQTITFFLGDVQANETDIYDPRPGAVPHIETGFHLTFSGLPAPTATPEPTAVPADTPISTPATAIPSDTPVSQATPAPASPTPEASEPMVFISGLVFVQGVAQVPDGSDLVARIGEYESDPAAAIATDGTYGGLVVDPGDTGFEGGEIRFFLNGVQARTTAVYQSGKLERTFDILFTDYPTPVPTRTPAPTNTPMPVPTNTPEPTETPTPLPPTSTPEPTQTPIPTQTPAPTPTVAPAPVPTSTLAAQSRPTPEPTAQSEEAGGCFSAGRASPLTGAANGLLLIAPLGLIGALRIARRGRP